MIAAEEERRFEDDRRALDASFAQIDKKGVQAILAGSKSSDPDRQWAYQILLEQIMPAHWKAAANRAEAVPGMSVRAAKGIVEAVQSDRVFSAAAWNELVRLWARIVRTAGVK